MKYSKTTRGFYDPEIHGDEIPEDGVDITDSEYQALMEGQALGKRIVPDANGMPSLIDPPALSADEVIKAQINDLEATITPRRVREAVLGTDGGWLAALDSQIVVLRTQLS